MRNKKTKTSPTNLSARIVVSRRVKKKEKNPNLEFPKQEPNKQTKLLIVVKGSMYVAGWARKKGQRRAD